jgi:hypothetical protein
MGFNARGDTGILKDYEDLFKSYEELQRSYRSVVAKHKSSIQTINKLKKELQSLKLRRLGGRGLQKKCQKSSGGCVKAVSKDRIDEKTNNLEEDCIERERLFERLGTAEEQLKTLWEESTRPGSRSDTDTLSNNHRRQLNEATAKLNLLQARNDYAESKIIAQGDKLEKILLLHGEYKSKYASLKRELQVCREKNEALEAKVLNFDEMKELLSELTDQNVFLERQVAELTPVHVHDEQLLTEFMREKQAAYDTLISENSQLRNDNERLVTMINSLDHDPGERQESKSLQKLQQQCDEKDRELQRTNDWLQAQIVINEAQEKKIKEREVACREELQAYRKKVDELTIKASQSLQRIRLLEAEVANSRFDLDSRMKSSPSLRPNENVLQVHITNGSLDFAERSDESLSFVLVDFFSFESMCSSITRGIRPTYDFIFSYKLDIDRFILQNLADGHMQIEIYTLQSIKAIPLLFASASISTSDLLLSGTIDIPKLNLRGPGDNQLVGTVAVTLELAQPLGRQLSEQFDNKNGRNHRVTEEERIFTDAIKIPMDRVVLTNDSGNG